MYPSRQTIIRRERSGCARGEGRGKKSNSRIRRAADPADIRNHLQGRLAERIKTVSLTGRTSVSSSSRGNRDEEKLHAHTAGEKPKQKEEPSSKTIIIYGCDIKGGLLLNDEEMTAVGRVNPVPAL